MITYDVNSYFGVAVIMRMSGSVMPQALMPSLISMLVAILVLLNVDADSDEAGEASLRNSSSSSADTIRLQIFDQFLKHPYPHQITSVMIGFMMVFRVQLSYQRYWEGIGVLTDMFTKWYDAAVQVCAFDELSTGEAEETGPAFRTHVIHLFSLMSMCSILEVKGEKLDMVLVEARDESARKQLQLPILRRIFCMEPPDPDYGGRDKISVVGGFLEGELEHLGEHEPHFVDCAMARLIRLISVRLKEGGLAMPPPIVSRIYQVRAPAASVAQAAGRQPRARAQSRRAHVRVRVRVAVSGGLAPDARDGATPACRSCPTAPSASTRPRRSPGCPSPSRTHSCSPS